MSGLSESKLFYSFGNKKFQVYQEITVLPKIDRTYAKKVEKGLLKRGAKSAKTDLYRNSFILRYDPKKISLNKIKKYLKNMGYTITSYD